ncbi:hypothetical protein ACW7N6_38045 [Streptomyces sp. UC1A3]
MSTDIDLDAVQRGVKLMERASATVYRRRHAWDAKPGWNWSSGHGSDYPWHNGVHGTARLDYSEDGRRYEVSVYTYSDGLRIFRKEYVTLDAALRNGTRVAGARPDPAAHVAAWNRRYPEGTPVRYWTGAREGEGAVGETRSAASVLEGHTAVVWVTGHSACVALSHVQPVRRMEA